MISGSRAETPLATMRAKGVMPSSRALVSDMTMTAAAPSLSGQALPAVMVPPSRNTGLRAARPSTVVPVAGPVVLGHHRAVLEGDGDDLALEEPVLLRRHAHACWLRAANSSISSRVTFSYSATFSAVWPMAM